MDLYRALSRLHLVPERIVIALATSLGYGSLRWRGAKSPEIVRGALNLAALLSVFAFLSTFFTMPPQVSLSLFLFPPFILVTLLLYPKLTKKRSTIMELRGALYSLDIFATVYCLTGSIKMAASYVASDSKFKVSDRFRKTLFLMRNGIEPKKALLAAFRESEQYHEWVRSVAHGSVSDTALLLSCWKSEAAKSLSKVEDTMAFVIVFSTLLPVVATIMGLVLGLGASPQVFLLVILQVLEFLVVYVWFKDLVVPIV